MPDRNRQTASNLRKPRLNWPKISDRRSFRGASGAGALADRRMARAEGLRRVEGGGRRTEGPGTLAEDRRPVPSPEGCWGGSPGGASGWLRHRCGRRRVPGQFRHGLRCSGGTVAQAAVCDLGKRWRGDAGWPSGCVNRREIGQKPRRSPGDCGCVKRVAYRLTCRLRRGGRLGGGCGEARRDGWRWSALRAVRVRCGRLLLAAFGRAGSLAGAGRRWRPVCAGW